MTDTELESRDIRAGYIAWCRGELPRDMAGEKFDRFIARVKAEAWDEGQQAGWDEAQEYWAVNGIVSDYHKYATAPNPNRGRGSSDD